MADCRNCGSKLPAFTFGELSDLCRNCKNEREAQRKRFAATNEYDFFTEALGPHRATFGLMGISIIVYAGMVYAGSDALAPETADLIAKGADYGPKTLGERQYWRLITNAFVHIGLLHIVLNMVCLWGLAKRLENFFGSVTTVVTYLLTGIGGSLLSLSWDAYRVSAGASGAIFGIAGALLAFIFHGRHDLTAYERNAEIRNVAQFALINLFLGLRSNTDNMAHLGGLVTGLLIGWLLGKRERAEQNGFPTFQFAVTAAVLTGVLTVVAHAKEPEMAFTLAYEAYDKGDYKQAIHGLEVYVSKYPLRGNAHGLLAYCYEMEKREADAQREYELAVKLDPRLSYAQQNLAHIYIAHGRYVDAIPLLEAAMNGEDSDDFTGYDDYATALFHIGRNANAEAALRKAIEAGIDSPSTHRNLARLLKQAGKNKDAAAEQTKAEQMDKELASAESK